jgi:hypothetical protein
LDFWQFHVKPGMRNDLVLLQLFEIGQVLPPSIARIQSVESLSILRLRARGHQWHILILNLKVTLLVYLVYDCVEPHLFLVRLQFLHVLTEG